MQSAHRWFRPLAAAAVLLTLSAAARGQTLDAADNETPRAWFVELASPPTVEGTSPATTKAEKQAFRNAVKQAGLNVKERFEFDTLFNGVSVQVDPAQLSALRQIDGVKNVWPVHTYSIPPTAEVSNPDLVTALKMTGADVAQNELGLTGAGIKVAVMDTGVDVDHPDLGGCFGSGCRVAFGTDLVGDHYDANFDDAAHAPVPDNNPDDCNGHGTHVAGIIGASPASPTGVKGVAPEVTFGAYRVFGCTGSTSDEIMIRAMELALADGMHVLNMSIGAAFTWPQSPTGVAASRLVNRGMVVVASIGNSGANGLYSAGAPGLGEKVIGVASFDNTNLNLAAFTASPDGAKFGYVTATAAPPAPLEGSFPMARTGTPASAADGCTALPAHSLDGKIALIRRGTCTFNAKAFNAQNAGAVAVVLYNNAAGLLSPTVAGPPAISIPVVAVTAADGVTLNNRIAAGDTTLTWTASIVSLSNATGNLISSFSSFGLAPDLTLKPDIGAPGGFIRSTFPLELGAYANISGTSMSSPHVAGAAALFLEAHPGTKAQALRAVLQNTATPKLWFGNPSLGFLENVHRQGAGMLQIDAAVLATTSVSPGKLSLGESEAGPSTQTLTLSNTGKSPVTFAVSHVPALATGPNTFSVSFLNAPSSVSLSASSVTVPAGGTASVTATISPSALLADNSVHGGYVVFTPGDEGETLRVPFAGFKGNYQSLQVLTPTANNFPRIGRALGGGSFALVPAGTTFTLANAGDVPNILFHLNHQARILRMEVLDAATGRSFHRLDNETFVGRNSTANGFFALPFNGISFVGNKNGLKGVFVPNGTYVVKISVLKALGDENNPADWESVTSPVFTIQRPQ